MVARRPRVARSVPEIRGVIHGEVYAMSTRQFVSAFVLVVLSAIALSASGESGMISVARSDSEVDRAFDALKAQSAEGRGYMLFFVVGAGHAYQRANMRCSSSDNGVSYCPPEKLELNAQNYAEIALREHATNPGLYQATWSSNPVEAIVNALGAGLERTFPCDTQCRQ
jgi:hypothetical protein